MKAWKLFLALSIMVLIFSMLAGCLFGGGSDDEAAGEAGPDTADAGGAPPPGGPGGPGDMGPPAGGPGGPGDMGPPAGPAAAPPSAGGAASAASALALKHEGRYDEAAAEYGSILAADPDNAGAHWGLAWILAEQGKATQARTHFEKFIELSDDQTRISEARAALERM